MKNKYTYKNTAEDIARDSEHNIKDKYFIVTGSNSGIGLETVRVLLKYGGIVTCACRNTIQMQEEINNFPGDTHSNKYYIMKCDLTDFDSIKEFAEEYKVNVGKLDVLINNAGVMSCPLSYTKNGYEMQFGTNHLGHYMLTGLLKDMLLESPSARLVSVSSIGHKMATEDHFDFSDMKNEVKHYDPHHRYGVSKLANVYFATGLAALWGDKVKCYSLHPGGIQTNLGRHMGCLSGLSMMGKFCWDMTHFSTARMKGIPEGASTQVYAAVSDEVLTLENGAYLDDNYKMKLGVQYRKDAETKLFEFSEQATGIKFEKI